MRNEWDTKAGHRAMEELGFHEIDDKGRDYCRWRAIEWLVKHHRRVNFYRWNGAKCTVRDSIGDHTIASDAVDAALVRAVNAVAKEKHNG